MAKQWMKVVFFLAGVLDAEAFAVEGATGFVFADLFTGAEGFAAAGSRFMLLRTRYIFIFMCQQFFFFFLQKRLFMKIGFSYTVKKNASLAATDNRIIALVL